MARSPRPPGRRRRRAAAPRGGRGRAGSSRASVARSAHWRSSRTRKSRSPGTLASRSSSAAASSPLSPIASAKGSYGHECLLGAAAVEHALRPGPRDSTANRAARRVLPLPASPAIRPTPTPSPWRSRRCAQPSELGRPPDEELRVDPAKLRRNALGRCVRREATPQCAASRPTAPRASSAAAVSGARENASARPHGRPLRRAGASARGAPPPTRDRARRRAETARRRGAASPASSEAAASCSSTAAVRASVLVAGFERPLVLEPRQELALGERERLFELSGGLRAARLRPRRPRRRRPDPTRSRVATSAPLACSPSCLRSAQSALRRLARALSSSTSGQKRAATAERGVEAGVQRQPGEQRGCAIEGRPACGPRRRPRRESRRSRGCGAFVRA